MKKRFTLALVLMAGLLSGCSSNSTPSTANTQPSVSPSPAVTEQIAEATPPADTMASAPKGNAMAPSRPAGPSGSAASIPSAQAPSSNVAPNTPPLASRPPQSQVAPAAPVATPHVVTLPAGKALTIYTANDLSTKDVKEGARFVGSLAQPIVDGEWVLAKKGAQVEGVVVESDPGGRVKGRASLSVKLQSLTLADGRKVDLSTSNYTVEAKATKTKDAAKVGIGAGIGAAIGAIAGGGKGAAIGAGAGAGAGTGVVMATRGDPAVIQSESAITFKLTAPVMVTKR